MDNQPTLDGEQASGDLTSRPRARRWLLTALGSAAAGFTASRLGAPGSAEAADGDELRIGQNNTASQRTKLTMQEGGDVVGFEVDHRVIPGGSLALGTTAIVGRGIGIFGAGVRGHGNVTGVAGESEGTGVEGSSTARWGVRGITRGSGGGTFIPAAGGRFETTVSQSIGAHAKVEDSGSGDISGSEALLAEAPNGNLAARFIGPVQYVGNLDVVGNFDLNGTLLARSAPVEGGEPAPAARFEGVAEFAALAGGVAARFEGPATFAGDVDLAGSMVIHGSIAQTRTAPGGGPAVESFAVQSLSEWLEDFGEVPMAGKKDLRVPLSAAFTAVANTASYMVFITAIGGDAPQVVSKDATGFSLRAQNANKAPESVCYRLVARPR